MEHLRLQQKEPKIGASGNLKAPWKSKFPRLMLAAPPPLQESLNTARMLPSLLCPTLSTRIEWNIRNVIDYLPCVYYIHSKLHDFFALQHHNPDFLNDNGPCSQWVRNHVDPCSILPWHGPWHEPGPEESNWYIKVRTEMGAMQAQCGCIMATFESTSGMMVWW